MGEISGVHTPGVDKSFGSNAHLLQTIGHAAVGCMQASVMGGSCGAGAAGAGFAAAAGPTLPGAEISAERFVSRLIVGGTAATLSGDKFANGAFSAAFAYLFNDLAGKMQQLARLAGRGAQLMTDFLIDAGAEKIHENLHMRANGVHAIADGVYKFPDSGHFIAGEVKLGGGDFTKNQNIVYRAVTSGQEIEMWGKGADKIAAKLGLTANEAGVYKVPAGRLQIEVLSFKYDGQLNPTRTQVLNEALRRGVNGRGGLD